MFVKYIWTTPNGEQLIGDMARVSAPENQGTDASKLISYLIKNHHWSPLEMVNLCVQIETTRDIARQLLRHRSFSFQEFSQRYAAIDKLPTADIRDCRMQDTKNRQNSLDTAPPSLVTWWQTIQNDHVKLAERDYKQALAFGIAKEVARSILPEGLTTSSLYMNGTLRSWVHFYQLRSGNGTQKETREIALSVGDIIQEHYPNIWKALLN